MLTLTKNFLSVWWSLLSSGLNTSQKWHIWNRKERIFRVVPLQYTVTLLCVYCLASVGSFDVFDCCSYSILLMLLQLSTFWCTESSIYRSWLCLSTGPCLRSASPAPLGLTSWHTLANKRSWLATAVSCRNTTISAMSKVMSLLLFRLLSDTFLSFPGSCQSVTFLSNLFYAFTIFNWTLNSETLKHRALEQLYSPSYESCPWQRMTLLKFPSECLGEQPLVYY